LLIVLTAGCTFRISPTETPVAEPIDPAFDVIGPVVPGCRDSLTVTTTEDRDDGACSAADCSLLEAVDLSNHCPGTQTVNLPAGEYSSAIVISDDATVVGAGAEDTVATGGLSITPAARAQIAGLTVRGRRVTVQAGGALELRNSRIERVEDFGYEVTPPGGGARFLGGAGLINSGEAVLDGVVVWGNRGLDFGGGVVNRGDLVIRNSTLENNWPAGLHSQVGSALIEDSTVTGSESGIRLWAGDLILRRTTVSDNTSVGVVRTAYTWPGGSLQIDRSSITGNGGSGVSAACVTIENSTLSGNDVGLEALSSELCPRSADLRFVTIAHNAGGGVLSTSAAEVRLHATILSANLGGDCQLAGGTIVSDGYNLDGDGSCPLTAAGASARC